jgi:hypothetical protein
MPYVSGGSMPTKAPLEQFLEKALQEFEREWQPAGLRPAAIDLRTRGARQFVAFLLGQSPAKGEHLKD